jgi:hypothetical protein
MYGQMQVNFMLILIGSLQPEVLQADIWQQLPH